MHASTSTRKLNKERQVTYRQRLKIRALATRLFPHCEECQSKTDLEWAHQKPTGLCGMGRGLDRRYRDVIQHPECYRLLCHDCHRDYDRRN